MKRTLAVSTTIIFMLMVTSATFGQSTTETKKEPVKPVAKTSALARTAPKESPDRAKPAQSFHSLFSRKQKDEPDQHAREARGVEEVHPAARPLEPQHSFYEDHLQAAHAIRAEDQLHFDGRRFDDAYFAANFGINHPLVVTPVIVPGGGTYMWFGSFWFSAPSMPVGFVWTRPVCIEYDAVNGFYYMTDLSTDPPTFVKVEAVVQ
ncbi:MAG: hypothetical protein WBF30_06350 [Candidatus Acidiferrales bacterium]